MIVSVDRRANQEAIGTLIEIEQKRLNCNLFNPKNAK